MNSTVKSTGKSKSQPAVQFDSESGPAAGASASIADRRIVILLVALTAAIYLRTVAPDVLAGDAGQFHFTAWRLGLSHPTGYPTYHIVGHLWQKLLALFGISPALALNALSGIIGAASLGLLYSFMRKRLPTPNLVPTNLGGQGLTQGAALFTALLFGWNLTYWSQNLIAEVYTLHVLFLLAIFGAAYNLEHNRARGLIVLSALVGLSLTHHGMTLFVIPALLFYLFMIHPGWFRRSWRTWAGILVAGALPLLLYLYIPLRGGPEASPWHHQQLGPETLTLYAGDWNAFIEYITGRSISVGFNSPVEAFQQLGFAFWLWRFHFTAAGLLLMGLGLFVLFRHRNYAVLILTGGYALTQQVFNLFYNIEDILVYYIPLYLMGAIWAGFGAQALATAAWGAGRSTPNGNKEEPDGKEPKPDTAADTATNTVTETAIEEAKEDEKSGTTERQWPARLGWAVMALLMLLPVTTLLNNFNLVDQSGSSAAREQWEAIMAAEPPPDAILATNDRDEIVGLLYMQWVEDRRRDLTGVFPLMAPDERFADIGATLNTALTAQEQNVFLIKDMPGLEVAFDLEPATPPLVRVLGQYSAEHSSRAMVATEHGLGQLLLEGYDWTWITPADSAVDSQRDDDSDTGEEGAELHAEIRLYWLVREPVPGDYTTTVQLFDEEGERIGQSDAPPGGVFYPTSLWKTGERMVETHTPALDPQWLENLASAGQSASPISVSLLIGMYEPVGMEQLAAPIQFEAEFPPLHLE